MVPRNSTDQTREKKSMCLQQSRGRADYSPPPSPGCMSYTYTVDQSSHTDPKDVDILILLGPQSHIGDKSLKS